MYSQKRGGGRWERARWREWKEGGRWRRSNSRYGGRGRYLDEKEGEGAGGGEEEAGGNGERGGKVGRGCEGGWVMWGLEHRCSNASSQTAALNKDFVQHDYSREEGERVAHTHEQTVAQH